MAALNKTRRGFTLVELMAVMAIMAIMMAIAVGAYLDYSRGAGMRAAQLNVHSQLAQTRQHAITHHLRTRFVYGNTATTNQGWYYTATNNGNDVVGITNFLADGIVFKAPDAVEFRLDGSCDGSIGSWTGNVMNVIICEDSRGTHGMATTIEVFMLTGRAGVE